MTERTQRGGVSRVLAKLDKSIEDGDFYESLQMYRTLYFRYIAQKKYNDCLELLYDGVVRMISHDQETSAADLGLLILETLEKRGIEGGDADINFWIEKLASIIAQIGPNIVERETLITRSLKWSGDVSGNTLGHPMLHKHIAQVFWSEQNLEQARHHYLLCRDGKQCGLALIQMNLSKGYKSELDLFIVQAVLQQLCLKESKVAEETFDTYTKNHPKIRQSTVPFYLPLLNFLHLLFRSIEIGRLDSFQTLCSLYKPSLQRDLSFDKYLTKIGILFFGVAPRQSGGMFGGMFGDLFSRIFQDFDGEDEDAEGQHNIHQSSQGNSMSAGLQNELD